MLRRFASAVITALAFALSPLVADAADVAERKYCGELTVRGAKLAMSIVSAMNSLSMQRGSPERSIMIAEYERAEKIALDLALDFRLVAALVLLELYQSEETARAAQDLQSDLDMVIDNLEQARARLEIMNGDDLISQAFELTREALTVWGERLELWKSTCQHVYGAAILTE